jgi:hypothetical protein
MTEPQHVRARPAGRPRSDKSHSPADPAPRWSEGIRALYDSVVQEPLPADFLKLLDELGKKAAK